MLIEVEGHAADRVIKALSGMPAVQEIHTTNGRWDLITTLSATSLPDLDQVLRRIRLIPGITASETNLLLATPRTTRGLRRRLSKASPRATRAPRGPNARSGTCAMVKTVYFIRHGQSTANIASDEKIERFPNRSFMSPRSFAVLHDPFSSGTATHR